jgi:hypothetical protein
VLSNRNKSIEPGPSRMINKIMSVAGLAQVWDVMDYANDILEVGQTIEAVSEAIEKCVTERL